ncbi:hypothetical protein BX616_001881 [Lobosporangium transversale]|uniref:PROP1-like PPR domain-containing protein n=1 Tax=Lobosporangium transversale TaxID=64571 RepID=A0A1Y2GBM4_9FUNG|nr:hypothetical protein BCR41DRAFT_212241 [Lobosporangium transversale]KAF9902599.1 hypothetical protein BX616_001881 [Lobosporangium transversale]ORZ00044.1 hypothetical protein BCR41DRAFT_212241 [Lobosporangium transversale]|eukprot:XP_021876085.1 hypothetical protein BCR41DRAFT_212241 [Lobosporangium transversale]
MHNSLQHFGRSSLTLPLTTTATTIRRIPHLGSTCRFLHLENRAPIQSHFKGAEGRLDSSSFSKWPQQQRKQMQRHIAQYSSVSTVIRYPVKTLSLDDLDINTLPPPPSRSDKNKERSCSSTTYDTTESSESAFERKEPALLDPSLTYPQSIVDFRELYKQVHDSNDPADMERVLTAYRKLADDPELLELLQPIDFMVTMNSCRELLHCIPRMNQILYGDISKTKYRHRVEFYNIVLKTFVKLSDFKSASNLVDTMRANKEIEFNNTATYHVLLNMCRHERSLKNARGILGQMRRNKVEMNDWTYLTMLSICSKCKNPRLAQEYFDEMPLVGIQWNINHYNALINAYAQAQDLQGAKRIFSQMEESGIEADHYTFVALITAHKHAGKLAEITEWIKNYGGAGTKPNAKVLLELGHEPFDIVKQCDKNGVELTLKDWNTLIIHSIKSNHFANIGRLLHQMSKRGSRPNVYTFTAMIDANIKMGKYQDAREVFKAMEHANIQPDVIAYSAMISGALTHGTVQESLETLKAMVDDGILPNLHTFNSLLSASVGEIGIEGFKIIRQTMQELKIRPDNRSFNALLSAYALRGDMEEMEQALEDMRKSRVIPDALTYSILISGYLQNGDLRFAMQWYYKMIEGGYRPATFVFNNLMAALHGSGQGEQVMMLWHEMERLRIKKNSQTFEIALEACEKFGMDSERIEEELKTYLATRGQFSINNRRDV